MAENNKDDYQHIRMLEEAEQNQAAANPDPAGNVRVSDVQYIDGDVESVKPFLAETHAKMLEETGSVDALIERTRERYSAKIESGEIPQAILDKEIEIIIDQILKKNNDEVVDYKKGKKKLKVGKFSCCFKRIFKIFGASRRFLKNPKNNDSFRKKNRKS